MIDARFRKAAAGIAVVAALGTLSACGGHGSAKAAGSSKAGNAPATDALTELRLAATKTGQADSAKINGTTSVSGVSTVMTGAVDWSSGMTGNIGIKMGGDASSALKQMGTSGNFQALYTPNAMYVNLGAAIAKTDGGKPWVKYDFDTLAKMTGGSSSALKQEFQNSNPTLAVNMLIASGDVKSLGSATVDGSKTTHYAGVLDVAKVIGSEPGMDKATVKSLKSQLQAQGITTDHIDVWVDGNGLLVKKVEKADMKSGTLNSTMNYTDYGVKVSVTPPPASQTEDAAAMLAAQGQS